MARGSRTMPAMPRRLWKKAYRIPATCAISTGAHRARIPPMEEHPARAPDLRSGMMELCDGVTEFLVHTAKTPGRVRPADANAGHAKRTMQAPPQPPCASHRIRIRAPGLDLHPGSSTRNRGADATRVLRQRPSSTTTQAARQRSPGCEPRHVRMSNTNAPAGRRARSIEIDANLLFR